jgi:hypothetical protein
MTPRAVIVTSLAFILASCGGPETRDPAPAGGAATPGAGSAAEDEHGTRAELGRREAFGRSFLVVQYGDVAAGEEAAFELEFASGRERITTARGWVGDQSGKGSLKSLWELEGENNLHGHVEVPAELAEGAALWIDLEVDGETETVSVSYR